MVCIWPCHRHQVLTVFILLTTCANAYNILQSKHLYDWGLYGLWPRTWFTTFDLGAPRLNFLKWNDACVDGFFLFALRGSYVAHSGPVILDARGNLIWMTAETFGEDGQDITDFKIQTYKENLYITFWAGSDGAEHQYGMGSYYMLDETYKVVKTVKAVETRGQDLKGDLHDFLITSQDTALLTVYHRQPADLSALGGPQDGWILDSIFQEVDMETGELLFEWRASEHIPVEDGMRTYMKSSDHGRDPGAGFDYFHINSIDKDHRGNYIISGRHTHQIICINPDGETVWILGGKENMFTDLSGGRATDFSWQHHARWYGNDTLTLFDNAKSPYGGRRYTGDHSRGLVLQIDADALTARLVHDYHDPAHPKLAKSQGSVQVLEGGSGNVLVDYGFYPTVTEFSAGGEVLCDVRLAPWLIWHLGMVTSYRGFKTTQWVGRPWYSPVTSLSPSEGVLYVSWNGATEVRSWVLQGADSDGVRDNVFEDLDVQAKDAFEASFKVSDSHIPQYLRVAAVDEHGTVLKYSQPVDRYVGNAKEKTSSSPSLSLLRGILITLGVLVSIAAVVALVRSKAPSALPTRFPQGSINMINVVAEIRKSLAWAGFSRFIAREPEYRELQSFED